MSLNANRINTSGGAKPIIMTKIMPGVGAFMTCHPVGQKTSRQNQIRRPMPPLGLILLLLFVAFPLLEIAVLIKVGAIIGVWMVLAIIVGTFILGTTVVRHQGLGVARRIMATARSGEPPVEPMMEGMLLMLAGALLIAPGLITDAIGLVLLIPPIRQAAARWATAKGFPLAVKVGRSRSQPSSGRPGARTGRSGPAPTIETDYERLDEKPAPPPSPPRRDPQA